ncbi:response regulator [Desulfatibacillum aliphaticivorans]|uniref:response regulator n=1 Tax=Desulfatibacillum aliphaticivorans TaxID=218208 RepID=UPI00040137D6|nr:response regulator [Desulfatibacillum aliphaticivorans]
MSQIQRILVVDDEPGILQNVTKILSKAEYEVFQASSAKEALEEMAKRSYSLLISDIVMPEMNGLELLKMVKNQWPLTQVLMMTAYASTETAVKAIRLGALDYLPKPFTPDELRALVDRSVAGDLYEASVGDVEREDIDAMHLNLPLDMLSEADVGEGFCDIGKKVCNVYQKLGHTCKAGEKKGLCPQEAKKAKSEDAAPAIQELIGVDMPFNYEEVVEATGPEYVANLGRDGFAFMPYEDLKASAARMEARLNRAKLAAMYKKKESRIPGTTDALSDITDAVGTEYVKHLDRDGFSRIPFEELKGSVEKMEAKLSGKEIELALASDILVVDDEVAVNNNIRKILKKGQYTVDQATTRDEALEKVSKGFYRVIILDLKMPGVVGLELLEAVHKMQPNAKIVIITGYASIETAVETSRLGAMLYVPKPFTPAEIRTAVEKASRLAA